MRACVALAGLCATSSLVAQEADLTPGLTMPSAWNSPALTDGWAPTLAQGPRLFRSRRSPCKMFGRTVSSATGCFENGRLTSFTVVFLDSGTWFGYVPDDQAKTAEAVRGAEFARLFREISAEVMQQLVATAGPGREMTLGVTPWLKQKATIFSSGGIGARLTVIPDQLVKLTVFRDPADAAQLLSPDRRTQEKGAQLRAFAGALRDTSAGDRLIDRLPVFPQGDRAYCGVAALAVAMRFCGLTLDTEEFAAAAGIRFGSTRKSHIREVYAAAAKEAGLQMFHSTRFEFARAQRTIDAGFPVIVFRRWNQERDYLHTTFAQRFAGDPAAELPRPDANDQKTWPKREGFAHASIINGYNAKRREVIFSESWSETARHRRMRTEELEGTAYLAYYPRL